MQQYIFIYIIYSICQLENKSEISVLKCGCVYVFFVSVYLLLRDYSIDKSKKNNNNVPEMIAIDLLIVRINDD